MTPNDDLGKFKYAVKRCFRIRTSETASFIFFGVRAACVRARAPMFEGAKRASPGPISIPSYNSLALAWSLSSLFIHKSP